jgi:hypothetical protein
VQNTFVSVVVLCMYFTGLLVASVMSVAIVVSTLIIVTGLIIYRYCTSFFAIFSKI